MSRSRSRSMLLGILLVTVSIGSKLMSFSSFRFGTLYTSSAKQQSKTKTAKSSFNGNQKSSSSSHEEKRNNNNNNNNNNINNNNNNNINNIELIWLLSFPNSGTTYTLQNIQYMSHATAGTNYAKEVYLLDHRDKQVEAFGKTSTTTSSPVPLVSVVVASRSDKDDNDGDNNVGIVGPWILNPFDDINIIPNRMLIKTHCTGYDDKANYRSSAKSLEQFVEGCTLLLSPDNSTTKKTTTTTSDLKKKKRKSQSHFLLTQDTNYIKGGHYDVDQIHGIVHLIRNPINNIVSRMHMGVKHRWQFWNETERTRYNVNTREGVLAWCQLTDELFWKDDAKHQNSSMYQEMERMTIGNDGDRTPCHAELFRYTQWHNRALELVRQHQEGKQKKSPTLRLYYEDYDNTNTTSIDTNTKQLLDYLQLDAEESLPLPFKTNGKNYQDFLFTREHRTKMKWLIRKLATNETWNMLKQGRYF